MVFGHKSSSQYLVTASETHLQVWDLLSCSGEHRVWWYTITKLWCYVVATLSCSIHCSTFTTKCFYSWAFLAKEWKALWSCSMFDVWEFILRTAVVVCSVVIDAFLSSAVVCEDQSVLHGIWSSESTHSCVCALREWPTIHTLWVTVHVNISYHTLIGRLCGWHCIIDLFTWRFRTIAVL